ncbi:MAG: T9SS type A sorting domain-containing protein [Candidatus Marinimicrobia bacterium]|nr:T9SS type A sorting domain-containing protein [Candidatus Neomarinimicrobiota bacterium]
MKIILLILCFSITSIFPLFAQTYFMEWQSQNGVEILENFVDGYITSESMIMNTDFNNDGKQDFIFNDIDNNILYVLNLSDYNILWSYQLPIISGAQEDCDFVGFADLTDENTNELVLRYEQWDSTGIASIAVVVNTTTNEYTIISRNVRWDVIIWNIIGSKSKLIFQVEDHIEIWGNGTTSIKNNSTQSLHFKLNQNYPNPFNPTTTINYQLNESGYVELKIYNVKGQLVDTLVKKYLDGDNHLVIWDAKSLHSGQYFYQISVNGKLSETKKAIYLK